VFVPGVLDVTPHLLGSTICLAAAGTHAKDIMRSGQRHSDSSHRRFKSCAPPFRRQARQRHTANQRITGPRYVNPLFWRSDWVCPGWVGTSEEVPVELTAPVHDTGDNSGANIRHTGLGPLVLHSASMRSWQLFVDGLLIGACSEAGRLKAGRHREPGQCKSRDDC